MNCQKICILLKKELFMLLISPPVYIASILLFVTTCTQFFFRQQFFIAGAGTSDMRTFYAFIPYISILVIPVLTMLVWSEENCGVVDTLPLSSTQLVLSKWLASICISTFWQIILLLVPLTVQRFGSVDWGQVLTANIVIMLYFCTVCALGQLFSLATRNQITAAILSAIILLVVNSIHLLLLYVNIPSYIITIAHSVSFAWHFDAASKGIFDTRDVLFYICVTSFLLYCSIFVRERRKGKK